MKYRAEIDGLRAIAVVVVIFFHADFWVFDGGFIGVDIFFVISGYLITNILIENFESGDFDFYDFYERRARRILPALYLVMIVCIPFAWVFMLPDAMENFGQSLVAATFFSNNVLLFITSGYWDLASDFKPLLHTWSLGVEEQYYLLFPAFLFFAWKLGENKVLLSLVFLSVSSLLLSEWLWLMGSTSAKILAANFYLLPTRAWELLVGSIVALFLREYGLMNSNFLSLSGLFLIIFSIFYFDSNTPYPSFYTLLPVGGSALLIVYSGKGSVTNIMLSSKFLVRAGLVSYSAYLWHQPIFAFARISMHAPLDNMMMFALIIFSFLLAALSWKLVEIPFRNVDFISRRFFLMLMLLLSLGLFFLGFLINDSNGLPSRVFDSNEGFKRSSHEFKITDFSKFKINRFLGNSKVKIFVSGDSYSADLTYLIYHVYGNEGVEIMNQRKSQCEVLEYLESNPAWESDIFVFAYDEGHDFECSMKLINKVEAKGKDLFLFGTKQFGDNLNWLSALGVPDRKSLCQPPSLEFMEIELREKRFFPVKNYISIFDWISHDGCVQVTTPEGELIASDRKHLTIAGVEYLARVGLRKSRFDKAIRKYAAK